MTQTSPKYLSLTSIPVLYKGFASDSVLFNSSFTSSILKKQRTRVYYILRDSLQLHCARFPVPLYSRIRRLKEKRSKSQDALIPRLITLVAISISSYWARLFISAIGKDICSRLACFWWSCCFSSPNLWPAYHIYRVSLDHAIEWGKCGPLVLLQDWIWTWGRVCLNWRLGVSTRASQSERQKGEAEPGKQKQGAVAQVLGDASAPQNWSTGKVPCSWQERDRGGHHAPSLNLTWIRFSSLGRCYGHLVGLGDCS